MTVNKVDLLITEFNRQFDYRVLLEHAKNSGDSCALNIEPKDDNLFFTFTQNDSKNILTIPIPYIENGVEFINVNGVVRPTGKYLHRATDRLMSYIDVIFEIMLGTPSLILPFEVHSSQMNTLQAITYGFKNNNLSVVIYSIQKKINYIVNRLPVHSTYMNSWAMNNRIMIIDKEFDVLVNPDEKHKYQVDKNIEFFDRGWTSIGLSDGSLADHNYILSVDLRKYTPFGLKMHNPQRNLYSTLGMKGDEKPLIMSKSMVELDKHGLSRHGWNLFTAFIDIPDVWEDQIMLDISHATKAVSYEKVYTAFGELYVTVGDLLKPGDKLFLNKFNKIVTFDVPCDIGEVVNIESIISNVGGEEVSAKRITVKYKRSIKEGAKITNLSANKGVIRFANLGYAIDPRNGNKRKIDVIVSSKAVLKRKNYAQVVEAVMNCLNEDKPMVVEDDAYTTLEMLQPALKRKGFNTDGTWECNTYVGKLKGVCGTVFWGLTHDAEDTVWNKNDIEEVNSRGLRVAGLKLSTIEFRAIRTRFGANSAVEREVLSYAQGSKDIVEQINILRSKVGKFTYTSKTFNVKDIKPLDSKTGIMYNTIDLTGSIMDPKLSEPFMLKLPVKYQVCLDTEGNIVYDGIPTDNISTLDIEVDKTIVFDKIYVPYINLRHPWKHDIGKVGLSDLSAALNTIILLSHRYINDDDPDKSSIKTLLYKSIYTYFKIVENKLGTKCGEISTYGLSVRHPHSAKAVATLSNDIPKDTVQIHTSMADMIGVRDGDIVLVERFPCLGFMSLRPQKVSVTDDEHCRYTIRASGNSLGSLTLDFDGDVLYIAAFKTKEAIEELEKEWYQPNKICKEAIEKFNAKMGIPRFKEMSLEDYNLHCFDTLTAQTHAKLVSRATGVKSYTGPVIALAYNLLRMIENSGLPESTETNVAVEVFMDTVANSVFKQKHGIKSLHHIVIDAVCSADHETLINEGFNPDIAVKICSIIKEKASKLGINDLVTYHNNAKKYNRSNIINLIVRKENHLYFLSRANLDASRVVNCLTNYKVVDVPSKIFNTIMTKKPVRTLTTSA